jgi:hypothetical protein
MNSNIVYLRNILAIGIENPLIPLCHQFRVAFFERLNIVLFIKIYRLTYVFFASNYMCIEPLGSFEILLTCSLNIYSSQEPFNLLWLFLLRNFEFKHAFRIILALLFANIRN